MSERIAIYPGSFDPPTYGHLDLIERGLRIFDRLVVAVARNNAKQALFTVDERMEMIEAITTSLERVTVTSFIGLTALFAKEQGATALIRGLRVLSDFEFELTMAVTNQKLNRDIDTVLLMPSERYIVLSSRLVREVAQFGGDLAEFVPPAIERRLQAKFAG
jgi:pantetheine-phosphate adenylyltransferase